MNENDKIKTNSLEAWVLAARPKTLARAAVPVMIAVALALKTAGWHDFRLIPALLCFLFAFFMQIDSNLINDYFDFVHGNDDLATRLGPKRACAEGWITPGAMRRGLFAVSALACLVGLPLIYYGGWEMIIVGAVCVLFAFLYTTFFLLPRLRRYPCSGVLRDCSGVFLLLCYHARQSEGRPLAGDRHLDRMRIGY